MYWRLSIGALFAAVIAGCGSGSGLSSIPPQSRLSQAKFSAPASGPIFNVYTAGSTPGFPSSASAWDIAPANATTMWFTDGGTPAIGTITSSGTVKEYSNGLPSGARPYSIVRDAKGNGWFTDQGSASVGRITPDGEITEYTNSKLNGTYPADVTVAPDDTAWFMSVGPTSYIVHASVAGKLTLYAVPSKLSPDGSLIADSAGDLWFMALWPNSDAVLVERKASGTLVRYSTGLEQAYEPCCPNLAPKRMVFGSDGNLWMTTLDYTRPNGNGANLLATLTSTGMKFVRIPTLGIKHTAITSGLTRLGNDLWMTGDDPFQFNGALWDMTSGESFKAYNVQFNPVAIASGTQGNLWITSHFGGSPSSIVQVVLP